VCKNFGLVCVAEQQKDRVKTVVDLSAYQGRNRNSKPQKKPRKIAEKNMVFEEGAKVPPAPECRPPSVVRETIEYQRYS
jgi:hypothetical protein